MTRTLILASTLWPAPCWPQHACQWPNPTPPPGSLSELLGLPPSQFDHPFKKELYILNQHDQEALRRVCRLDRPLLGCVIYVEAQKCVIAVADKETITRFHSYEATLRHEVAHCNGWRH